MVFRAIYEKIKQGLTRTRSVFSGIASLFRLRGKVDKDFLTELEKRLYLADVVNDIDGGLGADVGVVEVLFQLIEIMPVDAALEA